MKIELKIDGIYRSVELVEEASYLNGQDKSTLLKLLDKIHRQAKVWIIDAE